MQNRGQHFNANRQQNNNISNRVNNNDENNEKQQLNCIAIAIGWDWKFLYEANGTKEAIQIYRETVTY